MKLKYLFTIYNSIYFTIEFCRKFSWIFFSTGYVLCFLRNKLTTLRVSIYVALEKDERIISLEESNLSVFAAPSDVEVYPLKGNWIIIVLWWKFLYITHIQFIVVDFV